MQEGTECIIPKRFCLAEADRTRVVVCKFFKTKRFPDLNRNSGFLRPVCFAKEGREGEARLWILSLSFSLYVQNKDTSRKETDLGSGTRQLSLRPNYILGDRFGYPVEAQARPPWFGPIAGDSQISLSFFLNVCISQCMGLLFSPHQQMPISRASGKVQAVRFTWFLISVAIILI